MKPLGTGFPTDPYGRTYRPRAATLAIFAALLIVIVSSAQHYLDRFIILPIFHHYRLSRLTMAVLLVPILAGGWYLGWIAFLAWLQANFGRVVIPGWLVRLAFVEDRPAP
jgi:hypothetical protein